MMGVTVAYESVGRVHQKARTRDALIDATRALLAEGVVPTMEAAAAAAAVSRPPIPVFATIRALIVAAFPHVEQRSLLGPDAPTDPVARLQIVAENHTRRILKNEPQMRAVLRLSLEGVRPSELPMHQGLRTAWIEDALTPLDRRPQDQLRALIHGIAATLGIEAFTWLTDIAGLPREEAATIIRSNE